MEATDALWLLYEKEMLKDIGGLQEASVSQCFWLLLPLQPSDANYKQLFFPR